MNKSAGDTKSNARNSKSTVGDTETLIGNAIFIIKWLCVCMFMYSVFITLDILQSTWLPYGPYVYLAPTGVIYGLGFISISIEHANTICIMFSIVMSMMPKLSDNIFHRLYNMAVIFGALLVIGTFILVNFDDLYLRIYSVNYDKLLKYHKKYELNR